MSFPSPAIIAPALENWRWEYNGVELGVGTSYGVQRVEGLAGVPIRNGDVVLPRDHGETKGLDLLGGRSPLFDLWVSPLGGVSLQQLQVNLARATNVRPDEELPLWFKLPNLPVLCSMCRPRDRKGPYDADYATGGVWKPELPFKATDPRLYTQGKSGRVSAEETVREGGLTFPVGPFPITFGSVLPTTLEATNEGNIEVRPLLILTGPLTGPIITNTSIAGEPYLQITRPGAVEPTIAAGDQVLVDLGNPHLILYYAEGIEATRYTQGYEPEDIYNWLTPESTWWNLPASSTSRIALRATVSSAGTCEVQWSNGYVL